MMKQFLETIKTHPNKFAVLTLLILSLFQVKFGIVPGWKTIHDDFPNYYVSSKLLSERGDLSILYHNESFNEKVKTYGLQPVGQFALYAPPNALLFLPLTGMPPLQAKRAWLTFNILLIFVCGLLVKKLTQWSLVFSLITILLSGFALANDLFLGQVYLFMTVLLLAGMLFFRMNKNYFSCFLLGIVLATKYVSIVFIPSLFFMRKWKALITIFSGVLLLYLICLPFFGFDLFSYFFKQVLFSHINGLLYEGRPYAVQYQSWDSLLNNLFVYESKINPHPFIQSMALFYFFKLSLLATLLVVLTSFFIRSARHPLFLEITVSLSLISLLILEPGSATYHLLFLLLPFVLILRLMVQIKSPLTNVYITLYFLIGFLPVLLNKYTAFNGINLPRSDIRFFFSYHRLWLEMMFYLCSVYFLSLYLKNDPIQKTEPDSLAKQ